MFFQIVKDDKVSYYVNGADVQESNWMRYVNCSRVEEEQNLIAYQYRGEIFYRAYKDIQAGIELLILQNHMGPNGYTFSCLFSYQPFSPLYIYIAFVALSQSLIFLSLLVKSSE